METLAAWGTVITLVLILKAVLFPKRPRSMPPGASLRVVAAPDGAVRHRRRRPFRLPDVARDLSKAAACCKVLAVETWAAMCEGWQAGHAKPVRHMSSVVTTDYPAILPPMLPRWPQNPNFGTEPQVGPTTEQAPEPAPVAAVEPEKPDALGKLQAIETLYAKGVPPMDVYRLQQGEAEVIRRLSRDHKIAVKTLAKAMGGNYDARREAIKAMLVEAGDD